MCTGYFKGASLTALMAAMAIPAAAQDSDSSRFQLEEILVTAQKREQRLRDVPLSITAFTSDSIQRIGADRFEDYSRAVPSLVPAPVGPTTRFTLRGISTSTAALTTQPTVGIFIDDVPVTDNYIAFNSPDLRLFDVERVEILRGPQGTLLGASSLAGAVRIITAKPNLSEYEARVEMTGSTTAHGSESLALSGMVNVPVIEDKLAIRAVAYKRHNGGYIDDIGLDQKDANVTKTYGGRLYVGLQPTEDWNIIASVSYQNDLIRGYTGTFLNPPEGADELNWFSYIQPRVPSDLLTMQLQTTYDLGWADIFANISHSKQNALYVQDATLFSVVFGGLTIGTPYFFDSNTRTTVAEFRLVSKNDRPLRYVLGGFYNKKRRDFTARINQEAFVPIFGTDLIYQSDGPENPSRELAVFGDVTYALGDLEATVGLRAFKNRFSLTSITSGLSLGLPDTVLSITEENRSSSVTPRFSLKYNVSDTANVYATVAKGYRFGLVNAVNNPLAPKTYDSDSLWNYEIGAKGVFFDGRVSLESALYYIDWRDFQVNLVLPEGVGNFTVNGGKARSYGAEIAMAAQITDNLILEVSGSTPTPSWLRISPISCRTPESSAP
ncbi:MAG: TonB-dependent receptor [Sphingomonadales bacterium]|nr:TonB-dependent receptor [Sphingomonadales bacterium]